jgi:ribosomal peptide maturation radical SAM protein 1
MSEVCLVNMPYGAAERPSFALSLLKACLEGTEIGVSLVYANLLFAREIGVDLYKVIEESAAEMLIGEWTFGGVAFPGHPAAAADYRSFLAEHGAIAGPASPRGRSPLEVPKVLPSWEQVTRLRDLAAPFVDRVVDAVLAQRPRIVGCSSTFQQHCPSLALLRRLRERSPEVVTLLGGSNCEGPMGVTTRREFPWVDFVVSGEAEDLFEDLCRHLLAAGRDVDPAALPPGVLGPSFVPGAAAPRAMVRNFDNVPTPDYRDYFDQLHGAGLHGAVAPGLLAESARGCWWGQKAHCTFCGLVGSSMEFRAKSAARVVDEFLQLSRRYGVRTILVVDDIISMSFFDTVLPALAAAEQRVTLFYETKANLTREQMQAFADAGVSWIQPGIESMHQGALDAMLKGNAPWMNVQVLKWAQEMGIRVLWWMLHGIPGEEEREDGWYAEIAAWLPQLVHLQPPMGMNRIQYHRFSPYTTRPADFGLRLRAHRSYGYVYPITPESAYGLAYYFEDEDEVASEGEGAGAAGDRGAGPGLAALQEVLGRWRQLWGVVAPVGTPIVERPPVLSMIETPEAVTLYDSRPCAAAPEHTLRGLAHRVYRACDRARTMPSLRRALAPGGGPEPAAAAVAEVVADLEARRVLLSLGGRYLALAVREPIPLLPQRFPGGQVLRTASTPPPGPGVPQPALAGGRPFLG